MSFGGFIGSSSGGNSGGDGGSGVSRVVADSPYNNTMPTAATIAHQSQQLVTSPLTQPMFNSSPLSLALKPKMEGIGDMGLIGENFDAVAMGRSSREDEYESRSGSDNLDGGASGDDQDTPLGKSSRKKKYHRHTPYQIQELEAAFKENPHPDEKARLELGKRLTLESRQVKFWFQNRRTQMKTQLERHENAILKQENDKLRIENIAMKEAMRSPMCGHCGGQAILGEIHIEEHHLRIENARLRDELNRICVLANKFLGRPLGSFPGTMPPGMANSGLELAVGRNGFGAMNSVDTALPMGLDFGNGLSSPLTMMSPRPTPSMTSTDVSFDKSMLMELAFAAMNELLKLAEIGDPLWFRNFDGSGEALSLEEYARSFPPCIGMKPSNFTTEATKATGTVMINSLALVETLMDTSRWVDMFSCIVGRTSTIDVISSSASGSRNGNLQLIQAEFQVLSALVPVRQVKFLRFCKQHAEGVWAVVDVSIDAIQEGSQPREAGNCRRLPSGCIVQDLPNGYSKVIWIEHMEYDENTIHNFYRPFIRSGRGFGAQRWIATLQRQCECLAVITSSAVPSGDGAAVVSPSGRRSIAMLARRITRNFCGGVCATFYKWEPIQTGTAEDTKLMMRKSIGDPGEPPGIVLSATRTIWLPVTHQRLFDFLRNEQTRSQWDVLSHGGPMHQIVHIAKGQDLGNSISLFRANAAASDANQNSMLILQDSCTDVSGSIVAYAAVDTAEMNVVMSGGDSSCVAFLPSGFAIVPDCFQNSNNGMLEKEDNGGSSNGSLLTLGFQILVNSLPAAKLTMESVNTVNALISRTLQGIKTAFQCN
ncbi:PREDICTED: homeobox-leucine zipper protein HDG1-like isoform X1 [Nicotiana attenuata]|uniref:homeobox-leucine zipper protein HDG1-like isoform X1 n=2 Tax=Nicotiana attenuata TaxID=49451 RepID=UPI00090474C9|nr:PREDICTED: homeobox-leucine zipper protein HDG1-like isoform X1 [Nicotiana attenuata]